MLVASVLDSLGLRRLAQDECLPSHFAEVLQAFRPNIFCNWVCRHLPESTNDPRLNTFPCSPGNMPNNDLCTDVCREIHTTYRHRVSPRSDLPVESGDRFFHPRTCKKY